MGVNRSYPLGNYTPLRKKGVRFEWEKSKGADAYEFELLTQDNSVKKQVTKNSSVEFDSLPVGNYRWKVRSLAGESASDSSLIEVAVNEAESGGAIKIESGVQAYRFNLDSQESLANTTWKTNAPTYKLYAEFKLGRLRLLGSIEDEVFQTPVQTLHQKRFELGTKFPVRLDSAKQWIFSPSIKIAYRDYYQLNVDPVLGKTAPYLQETQSALGPVIGIELKKLWNSFAVALRADYFVPATFVSTSSGQVVTRELSSLNLRTVSELTIPIGIDWALGFSFSWEINTLQYKLRGADEKFSYSLFGGGSSLLWSF